MIITRQLKSAILLCVIICFSVVSLMAGTTDDLIRRYLIDTYDLDKDSYLIEIVRNPLSEENITDDQFRVRSLTRGEPIGPFTLLAETIEQGKTIKRVQISVQIRKFASVLVVTDRIARHKLLLNSMFEMKRMEITSLREQPVSVADTILGFRSARNLPKGKILTYGVMEQVPDIEVGREISIVFNQSGFKITVPGRAMQDGKRGEFVRVKNLTSGRIIMARVIDKSSVAIEL